MAQSTERFSNSISKLRGAGKKEIEDFVIEENEKILVAFSEFPSIVGIPYQIVLIENNQGVMRFCFRAWEKEYDLIRWKNGIYNLDRLRIIAKERYLSKEEFQVWKDYFTHLKTQELPNTLDDDTCIRLDGSDFELKIQTKTINVHYKWGIERKEIELFTPLIEMLSQYFLLE